MVVAVGLTDVELLAAVEVKFPGVMAIEVAPEVDQVSVTLAPEVMVSELAVKEEIVGAEPTGVGWDELLIPAQPGMRTTIRSRRTRFRRGPLA